MKTYSDEYIEHFAKQFVEMRLDLHGMDLLQYLDDPKQYEHLRYAPLPLLPKQRAVASRLENIASSTPEVIGPCDLCGLVSHHLAVGACPSCVNKFTYLNNFQESNHG